MTNIDRHKNLDDARTILLLAASTAVPGGAAQKILWSAIRDYESALRLIEALLAEDTAGLCGECKAELADIYTHDDCDCPAHEDVCSSANGHDNANARAN